MAYTNENLVKIIKAAQKAVKDSGIADPELKQTAFDFALRYQFQMIQGDKESL